MKKRDFIKITTVTFLLVFCGINCSFAEKDTQTTDYRSDFEKDIFKTSEGDLKITFIGHGSYMFTFNNKVIYIDPWSKMADYSKLPNFFINQYFSA